MTNSLHKSLHIPQRDRLIVALILFIGVCYLVFNSAMVLLMDDYIFGPNTAKYIRGSISRYYWWFDWFRATQNGRMANFIAPFFLNYVPYWVLNLCDSIMRMLMLAIPIRIAVPARFSVSSRVVLLSMLVFVMPWWDSLQIFDYSFNYVWATVIGLIAISAILNYPQSANVWLTLFMIGFCFFSGAFHEAMGIPLTCGFIAYFVMSRKAWQMSRSQYLLIVAFMAGAVFAFSSSGLWYRFHRIDEPDVTTTELLLKSDIFALLLVMLLLVQLVINPRRLIKALSTPWVIFVVAAVASMCFSLVSRIVGRSGWFAQIFALIALYRWADMHDMYIAKWNSRLLNWALSLLIVVHCAGVTYYQYFVAGPQLKGCLAACEKHDRGTVYFDALKDCDMPWWLLHKVRTVPDADDGWFLHQFTLAYSDFVNPIVLIPTQVKQINANDVKGELALDNGDFLTDRIPKGTTVRMWLARGDKHYVVVPFYHQNVRLYLITPHELDPGDY